MRGAFIQGHGVPQRLIGVGGRAGIRPYSPESSG
jgi:hypothetical protein